MTPPIPGNWTTTCLPLHPKQVQSLPFSKSSSGSGGGGSAAAVDEHGGISNTSGGGGIHGGSNGGPIFRRGSLMIAGAPLRQFLRDLGTVGHKTRWLLNWTFRTGNPSDPGLHAELAHVGVHLEDVVLHLELHNLIHTPARRLEWMFMQEIPPHLALMLVHLRTEQYILLSLLQMQCELRHP